MAINSRTKGANFEREIGNMLVEQLDLKQPVKRILEQTRTKELPDLKLGRWCLECKRYGDGAEPSQDWWNQVLSATGEGEFPALIYKFNRRPIKVRILVVLMLVILLIMLMLLCQEISALNLFYMIHMETVCVVLMV